MTGNAPEHNDRSKLWFDHHAIRLSRLRFAILAIKPDSLRQNQKAARIAPYIPRAALIEFLNARTHSWHNALTVEDGYAISRITIHAAGASHTRADMVSIDVALKQGRAPADAAFEHCAFNMWGIGHQFTPIRPLFVGCTVEGDDFTTVKYNDGENPYRALFDALPPDVRDHLPAEPLIEPFRQNGRSQ